MAVIMFSIIIALSILTVVGMGVYTLYRCDGKKRMSFIVMIFPGLFLLLGFLLEINSVNAESILLAMNVRTTGFTFVVVTVLVFVANYCDIKLPNKLIVALTSLSTLFVVLIWTNARHHLLFTTYRMRTDTLMPFFSADYSPVAVVGYVYIFACLCAAIGILIYKMTKVDAKTRVRLIVLSAVTSLALLSGVAYITNPFEHYITYAIVAGLAFVTLIFINVAGYKMFETIELLDTSPFGCMVLDTQGKVVEMNQASLDFFGVATKQEYLNNARYLTPEYQPDGTHSHSYVRSYFRDLIEDGEKKVIPHWVQQTIDGELRHYEATLSPVRIEGEDRVILHMRDLRERIELEKALNEAQLASRTKDKFLARMSHEIRTPMHAVLGITELLLRRDDHSQETTDALLRMHDSSNFLFNIINDILDISKVEAGKMEIIPVKYDTTFLIVDATQLNIAYTDEKNIKFTLSVDANLPTDLIGDELRIKQILNNLLSNAFKYTARGEVCLSVGWENEALVLSVRDTGQGMTKNEVRHLSESEYVRFRARSNQIIQGTGLGISIVNQLVSLMGGKLDIQSELGHGSTFTVCLPQQADEGCSVLGEEVVQKLEKLDFEDFLKNRGKRRAVDPMPHGRVLVVDDTETNLYVTGGLLRSYSIDVETVRSGMEAIAKIEDGEVYDIIFMDHMMPEMDGITATKLIRQAGYEHPIVALSANVMGEASGEFLENGFQGFVVKPIDINQLEECLVRFIGSHRKIALNEIPDDVVKFALLDLSNAVKIISDFVDSGAEQDEAMLDAYLIKIHGMKSIMPVIGRTDLADTAAYLEKAGKAKDFITLKNETPSFLAQLRQVIEQLNDV